MPEFTFCTGIECSYPTIDGGRWRLDQLEATEHYRRWRTDLALVRELGIRCLRYGPPLHRIFRGPGKYDWEFMDGVAAEMQKLEIVPIIDLCHFGVPDWLENFQNPALPKYLAEYARAFAVRYPWVRHYTPVNEMYVAARRSALDGVWNEQLKSDEAFVTATCHVAKASVLMQQELLRERPDAMFVQAESSEFFQPCCPDPEIQRIADFENQRRFIALDLLYAHEIREDVRNYLFDHGMPASEYSWFMEQNVAHRGILGLDYYTWNEKLIDSNGRPEILGELFGWYVITAQYHRRYQRPLMHTETNMQDAKVAPNWLWRQWHNVELIRKEGIPVVGFTWYSLQDQIDWDIGLSASHGTVFPVGLFDLNRHPRPVAQAYRHLISLFSREQLSGEEAKWSLL